MNLCEYVLCVINAYCICLSEGYRLYLHSLFLPEKVRSLIIGVVRCMFQFLKLEQREMYFLL